MCRSPPTSAACSMSARATPLPRAASSTSSRTTRPRRPRSTRCAPSSAGTATRKCSPTTISARHSASRTRPKLRRALPGGFCARSQRRGGAGLLAEGCRLPAPAQRLDQRDARREAALANAEQILLIIQRDGLGGHHRGICDGACLVLIEGELHRQVRGLDGLILDLVLLFQDAQGGEIVLDLLKRHEHRLAVVGNRGVVGGTR